MAGERFHDGLYDHLAELLQNAVVFWHPDQEEPARDREKRDRDRKQVRDHFSAEALRQREKRSKRSKQKPAP